MKILLLFFTIFAPLFAQAQLYIGSNIGYQYEIFYANNKKAFNNAQNITLKAGYGDISNYGVELSLDYTKNNSNIISTNDSDRFGFNIDILKAFDFDIFFNPYIKAGFGSGYMEVDRTGSSSITYGSFNVGGGLFIPISKHLDLEFGYVYKHLSYENINLLDEIQKPTAQQQTSYAGFNFRF